LGEAEWYALAATPDTPAGLNERRVTVSALTPSGALLLEPARGISLYASYGTSFNPIFQQVDADGQPFEPTRGEQVEAGLKAERGPLAVTLAAFSLHKRGALSTSPEGFYVQTGGQRSRGIELDLSASTTSLSVLAAYTVLDARVTADEVVPVGNRLPAAPRHAGRVWGSYDFSPGARRGMSLSLGVQGVGERYGTLGNELRLPAYVLVDAGTTLRASPRLAFQLTGENLLDARYFIRAVPRMAGAPLVVGWPGAPRALTLRLRVDLSAGAR
jgi:iron complex outermembrane recepter protein